MRSWTLGKSQGASSSVPEKIEPIDFFGDGVVLVDHVATGPQRGHSLLEAVVGHRAKNESARRADLSMKLGQSRAVTYLATWCTTGLKPLAVKTASMSRREGRSESTSASSAGKKCRCGKSDSRVPLQMQTWPPFRDTRWHSRATAVGSVR